MTATIRRVTRATVAVLFLGLVVSSRGAQFSINIGSNANDGAGMSLRLAGATINSNFTELFTNSVLLSSSNVLTCNTLWVDGLYGDDSTGQTNNPLRPFRTCSAAKSNAVATDLIIVRKAEYTDRNLTKSNVFWRFETAARVSYTIPTNTDSGYGIFDDRAPGAAGPCVVDGYGEFVFRNSNPVNVNAIGGFVVTNANSEVSFSGKRVQVSSRGGSHYTAAITVLNCTNWGHLRFDEVSDTGDLWSDLDPDEPAFSKSLGMGIYWELGNVTADIKRIFLQNGNPVYGNDPTTTGATNGFYLTSEIITNAGGQSVIYFKSPGLFYKSWISAKEVIGANTPAGSYFGGRNYLDAQKLKGVIGLLFSPVNSCEFWGRIEKIEASQQWLATTAGTNTIDLTVQEFSDANKTGSSTINGGIDIGAWGTTHIHGGRLAAGTNALDLVRWEGGGTLILDGTIVNGSNLANTNAPINVVSNGLVVKGADVLVGSVGSYSFFANAARTVQFWGPGMGTKTNSPLVTQQPANSLIIVPTALLP